MTKSKQGYILLKSKTILFRGWDMINLNVKEILSLLLSVNYTYNKNEEFNYSNEPRPCHNFAFMLEGEGIINSNGNTIHLKKGDILFIPKNTTYSAVWKATPTVNFHSLHFDFLPKNDPLFNVNIAVQKLDNVEFDKNYYILQEITKLQFKKPNDNFILISNFYQLLGNLFKDTKINENAPLNKTISPAVAYIEQNYTEQFSVKQLADLCFLSQSRFYYLFKKHIGQTPIEYKLNISVRRSAQDLIYRIQTPISQIAEQHGFSSIVYYERVFKKVMGISPSCYRKKGLLF